MDFKRKINKKSETELSRTLRGVKSRHSKSLALLGVIGCLLTVAGLWFGTEYMSDPEVDETFLLDASPFVRKHVVVAEDSAESFLESSQQGGSNEPIKTGSATYGNWNNLSGYYWGDYPLELYPLSTMCERGCSDAAILACVGDKGQAYGLMQLDYRYDLVPFMKEAYASNPTAWQGFAPFINLQPGDATLVGNQGIIDAFNYCYQNYPEVYMEKQPNFFVKEYLYNDEVTAILNAHNFKLDDHSVFVAAALMSCNINCGYITGTQNFFKAGATNEMSDEELLNCVYTGWRMYRTASKWAQTNHRLAIDKTGEEGVALQFLHGEIDITTFDNSKTCAFGAGWDGPNAVRISWRK